MTCGEGEHREVLLVEDHPVVCKGIRVVVEEQDDMSVCSTASSADDALSKVELNAPDVAVIDLVLPDRNGLDLIRDIVEHYPDVAILVVSAHSEALYAERSLRAGALGFIHKREAMADIIKGIRAVLEGEIYISDRISSQMIRRQVGADGADVASPPEELSDRELEVFELIGRGHSSEQIADKLQI
ncbi:MAG: response regulator, partial [Planctomycetota bacterium]